MRRTKINDTVWFQLKTLSPTLSKKVSTWAAYNHLLSKKTPKIIAIMLLVINERENWDQLLNTLTEAKKL